MGRTGRLRYRHLRRTIIAVSGALAVVVLLVLGLWRTLESEAVRSFSARRLEMAAKGIAGVDLEIGDLGWTLLPPRVVLSDVTLESDVFRVEMDHAAVEPGALFVARRTVVLDTIEARGVRVVLREGAVGDERGGGSPVRLAVRHLELKAVAFEGSDLPGGIDLVVVGADLAWVQERGETRGFFSIEQAGVDAPGLEPLVLGVDGTFVNGQGGLQVPTLRLAGVDFDLEGTAAWDGGVLKGRLLARLGLEELDRVTGAGDLLEGNLTVEADIDTEREFVVESRLASDRLTVSGFPIEGFKASVALGPGGLVGEVHQGVFLGGRLEGRYRLGRLAMPFPHEVEATCSGLDLADLLVKLGVPSGGMSSSVDITAELAWNSDRFPEGEGMATAVLRGTEGPLPVTGLLTLGLDHEGLLQFSADELHVGSSRVHLEGPLVIGAWAPEWGIHVAPAQLSEILPAVNQWVGEAIFPAEISGHGSLNVGLSGPWKQLTVGIRMDVEDVSYPPVVLDRLVLDASIAGGECRLVNGRYRLGSGGGQVSGAIRWAPGPGENPLDLQIDGHRLPLNRVASWINVPSGVVSGEGSFTGGLRGPVDDSRGSWALALSGVEIAGTEVGSGSATVDLQGGAFTAAGVNFDEGLSGQVRWDLVADTLIGDLGWDGMSFEALPISLRRLFGHVFDWRAVFEWPLAEALPRGRLMVSGEDSQFSASLDQNGLATSATIDGIATGEVKAAFEEDGTSWSGQGSVRIGAVDVLGRRLAPEVSPPLTGSIEVPLRIWGRRGTILGLEGIFEGGDLRLGTQPAEIADDQGFRWDSRGFRLGGLEIDVGGDRVFLKGGIDGEGRLEGHVSGVFDAQLFRVFIPEWELAGRAKGTVEILGTVDVPRLEGIAHVEHGSFRLPGTRTVVGDVDGSLFLSAGEVALEGLSFKFMRGRGRGRGRILVDRGEAHLRLDGTIEGLDYPLFPGFVPRIDGQWGLEGPVDDLELSGDLVVTRGEVRRQDDLPSLLLDWFGQVGPPAQDGLRLDLRVRADENLVSRSPFLRLEGSADLNITGTDARPGLVGSVEFMEGGEFTLQGIRYELERGQIGFSDPTRVDPMLDFQARATIREYNVWLSLTGTIDRLVPTVSSDPPLNPAEIYSLMALGQVGQGEAGGAVGMTLASTLLTRRMNEVLGSREQWLLPVDQIRVDPFIESATGDPSARVTVVKQLSPSVTVTLQSNLTGDMDEIISARWYLGSGFFIEASRDSRTSDGSYGLDFKMRRRY